MKTLKKKIQQTEEIAIPDSISNYKDILYYKIDHIKLIIEPDFKKKILINCYEELEITLLHESSSIELDCAEMKIHNIFMHNYDDDYNNNNQIQNQKLEFEYKKDKDKLIVYLPKKSLKDNKIKISIIYSTGYFFRNNKPSSPRNGFHFIDGENDKYIQSWTQGEANESKYWLITLEDQRIRYSREIHIIVPRELTVLSNGRLSDKRIKNNNRIEWIWKVDDLLPTYLTSIVIGKFSYHSEFYKNIKLEYYWPIDIQANHAMLTFNKTKNMMEFFENYLMVKYPYEKYAQVAVDSFEFGGMENASCTTITRDILHDQTVSNEYNTDILLIAHELAHQWFGDLITAMDWSHIWLNEGFATYCEILYFEHEFGNNDAKYELLKIVDEYISSTKNKGEKHPLVTKKFFHPDDLFDTHSYQKGACILHMLKNTVGDNKFRKTLNKYIENNRDKSVNTEDFRKILESEYNKSLELFFDEWIYSEGHPILEIEFEKELNKIKIIIKQIQSEKLFHFNLEIKTIFKNRQANKILKRNFFISKKENIFYIDLDKKNDLFSISIDPDLILLKEIKTIKSKNEDGNFKLVELLLNQMIKGENTIERIDAVRFLKNKYSEKVVDVMIERIINEKFYGIQIEILNTLGSYYDKNDYHKSQYVFNKLITFFEKDKNKKNKNKFDSLDTRVKTAFIKNLGLFGQDIIITHLKKIIENEKSSFLISAAAKALGKIGKELSNKKDKKEIILFLEEIVKGPDSFQNLKEVGAINGLKEFHDDSDINIITKITDILIDTANNRKKYFARNSSIIVLSKFLNNSNENNNSSILDEKSKKIMKKINNKVFDLLVQSLKDQRRKIKISSIKSLCDKETKIHPNDERFPILLNSIIYVAEHDLDGFVRKIARKGIESIMRSTKEWTEKSLNIELKIREK